MDENDAKVLRYSGMMGHEFNLTVDDGKGGRRVSAEVNDVATARRLAAEQADRQPRIYRKAGKGWKLTA